MSFSSNKAFLSSRASAFSPFCYRWEVGPHDSSSQRPWKVHCLLVYTQDFSLGTASHEWRIWALKTEVVFLTNALFSPIIWTGTTKKPPPAHFGESIFSYHAIKAIFAYWPNDPSSNPCDMRAEHQAGLMEFWYIKTCRSLSQIWNTRLLS